MEKIELRKARNFSTLFNDSVAFLRLNFKSFFGILLLLTGPFVLITGLLMGYLQFIAEKINESNLLAGNYRQTNLFLSSSISTGVLFGLIFLLTTLVSNASIALYFKLYDTSQPNELPIKRVSISPFLAAACWRLFYNLLLFALIMVVVAFAFMGLFFILLAIPGLNILFGVVGFLGLLILVPPLMYVVTVSNFIVIRDEILITEAIGKAIKYMRGYYWQTWLFMFCGMVALSMLYVLFNIPGFLYGFFGSFLRGAPGINSFSTGTSVLFIILSAVSMLGRLVIITPILTCFSIFNFFNHEESYEGTSLMNRINMLDNN